MGQISEIEQTIPDSLDDSEIIDSVLEDWENGDPKVTPQEPIAKTTNELVGRSDETSTELAKTSDGITSTELTKTSDGATSTELVKTSDGSDDAQIKSEDNAKFEVGQRCETKELYSDGKSACRCCTTWTDQKPFVEKKNGTDDEHSSYAIIRRQAAHGDDWKTHSILINSKEIKRAMANVFSDYPIDILAPELIFESPFIPLCHRWQKLVEYEEGDLEVTEKQHLSLLREALEPELRTSIRSMQSFDNTGYAAFDILPLICIPGEVFIHSVDGVLSAGVLRNISLRKNSQTNSRWYVFEVSVVDWDGEVFGVKKEAWYLDEFDGSQPLTTLDVFPLRIHDEHQVIEDHLIARGQLFESMKGLHFKYYTGRAGYLSDDAFGWFNPTYKFRPVDERIIIDAHGYYSLQDKCGPTLDALDTLDRVIRPSHGISDGHSLLRVDRYWDDDDNRRPSRKTGNASQAKDIKPLTDKQKLLTVATVKGFALDTKSWCDFDVTRITEISWKLHSIDMLVLSDDEKQLVLGFLASDQVRKEESYDDFIPGKGKGIIMLLSGPPGVGKTLTAESVAEHLKRPLYRLNMSDLGTSTSTVEPRLKQALLRCARWEAVLLLDEADVYLEERSMDSLERNELVSIFLRLLEYYEGVMILTTNRIKTIDKAFESRIDIILAYDDLSEEGRAQVWRNFLKNVSDHSLDDAAISTLSATPLNGRQIKSAVKTARILAAHEGVPLTINHIQTVIRLRKKAEVLLGGAEKSTK